MLPHTRLRAVPQQCPRNLSLGVISLMAWYASGRGVFHVRNFEFDRATDRRHECEPPGASARGTSDVCLQDVVCASEGRSSDRLLGMEGGHLQPSGGSYSSLRKPLVRRSRSEHSLSNKGEEGWPSTCTPRALSTLRGRQWGRQMALVMCIAWPALAFMLVSQVPWLELSIQWTTPNVQGIQWMFGNNKGGTCATAAR